MFSRKGYKLWINIGKTLMNLPEKMLMEALNTFLLLSHGMTQTFQWIPQAGQKWN